MGNSLKQKTADLLFQIPKRPIKLSHLFPNQNEVLSIDVKSDHTDFQNEIFQIDINRKYMSLKKITYQDRVQENTILRRLDLNASHQNPSIMELPNSIDKKLVTLMEKYESHKFDKSTHMHIYIEGYAEKWAFPPEAFFELPQEEEILHYLSKFIDYCNITPQPKFTAKDLFYAGY